MRGESRARRAFWEAAPSARRSGAMLLLEGAASLCEAESAGPRGPRPEVWLLSRCSEAGLTRDARACDSGFGVQPRGAAGASAPGGAGAGRRRERRGVLRGAPPRRRGRPGRGCLWGARCRARCCVCAQSDVSLAKAPEPAALPPAVALTRRGCRRPRRLEASGPAAQLPPGAAAAPKQRLPCRALGAGPKLEESQATRGAGSAPETLRICALLSHVRFSWEVHCEHIGPI